MDPTAVLSNMQTNEKSPMSSPLFFPKASFCDPTFTYSVGANQTACGSADILSHLMEVYFNRNQNLFMLDRCMEGMMKTVIKYAPLAMHEPDNYEARAKACALLGVQADDLNVSYEVLEMPQKTGFLGLKTTPAKVRVSVEEPDAPAAPVVEEKVEPEVKPVVEEAPAEEEAKA